MPDEDKIKPITIKPSPRVREMIEAIMQEKGIKTLSGAIFYCVGEIYGRLYPTYMVRRGGGGETLTPEARAKDKVAFTQAEKKEKERVELEEKTYICEVLLKGEVVDDTNGKTCVFKTYNFDTADEQKVPLEMVSEEFARHQRISPNQ